MTSMTCSLRILVGTDGALLLDIKPSEAFKRDLLALMRKHGCGLQVQISLASHNVRTVRGLWPSNIETLLAATLVLSQDRHQGDRVTYDSVADLCRRARVRIPQGNHLHVTTALARRKGLVRPAGTPVRGGIALTQSGIQRAREILHEYQELEKRLVQARDEPRH